MLRPNIFEIVAGRDEKIDALSGKEMVCEIDKIVLLSCHSVSSNTNNSSRDRKSVTVTAILLAFGLLETGFARFFIFFSKIFKSSTRSCAN